MKIVDKVKKGLIGIWGLVLNVPTKVFAVIERPVGDILYGIPEPPQADYGIPKPSAIELIWKFSKIFVIPIALLIGIIVYLKKSKSSSRKKAITVLSTIIIALILYILINYVI